MQLGLLQLLWQFLMDLFALFYHKILSKLFRYWIWLAGSYSLLMTEICTTSSHVFTNSITMIFCDKKCDFVYSEFVKTCDEPVVGCVKHFPLRMVSSWPTNWKFQLNLFGVSVTTVVKLEEAILICRFSYTILCECFMLLPPISQLWSHYARYS